MEANMVYLETEESRPGHNRITKNIRHPGVFMKKHIFTRLAAAALAMALALAGFTLLSTKNDR